MSDRSAVRVTAAVIRRDSHVLLARRAAGSHLAGRWEFPGGKIEDGESPEECLARELEEEFGVGAVVGEFVASSRYRYGENEIELLAYEARLEPGELRLESHDQVAWVRPGELLRWELAPADVPIAELLVAGL